MPEDLQRMIEVTSIYEIFDLSLFLGMILVMLLLLQRKRGIRSLQAKYFQKMILSIIGLLVLDDVLWLLNGRTPSLLYALTFFYFIAETFPLILWLCYLDYYIFRSFQRLKRRWFYTQPLIIIVVILIVSVPYDFIFTVDSSGLYRRGPGIPIIMGIHAALLLAPMVMAGFRKEDLGSRAFTIIILYGFLPILGSIGQVLLYETTVLWPSVALAAIFAYLYLENHRETRDYLTGLYNRQQIDDLVQSRMTEYNRRGGFALLMIDMDDFKAINDRFGHKEGDRALVALAEVLDKEVRSIDHVGRFGGDEFLILLEEDDPKRIEVVIERIASRTKVLNENAAKDYRLEFSCGYAIYAPSEHKDIDSLQRCVDEAMYEVKNRKKTGGD